MNEKILRKPCNVKINPDTLHEARVEALRARKPLGAWQEEAIYTRRLKGNKRRLNEERPVAAGLSGE